MLHGLLLLSIAMPCLWSKHFSRSTLHFDPPLVWVSLPLSEASIVPVKRKSVPLPVASKSRALPVSLPIHQRRRTLLEKKEVALRRSPRKNDAVHTTVPPRMKPVLPHSSPVKAQAVVAKPVLTQQQILARKRAKAQRQKHLNALLQRYQGDIVHAIAQNWVLPPEVDKHLSCQLSILTSPKGVVRKVQVLRSSGHAQFDRSAVTAVMKASPLPVPKETALSGQFRSLRLTVRPQAAM